MADTPKAKASGPLWCLPIQSSGGPDYSTIDASRRNFLESWRPLLEPCRILPGHGKWVPLELVEAIATEFHGSLNVTDGWIERVGAAIHAAKEGAA